MVELVSQPSLLKGVKVLELEGYLPVRFLGKTLVDLGADVTEITGKAGFEVMEIMKQLNEGKSKIFLDLKMEKEKAIFLEMIKKADILLESYRPGTLEKLGLGGETLLSENPKLIIVRLSGYGQTGNMSLEPGHDINYLGLSGATYDFITEDKSRLIHPNLILADLFGGVVTPLYHISQAIVNTHITGKGCILDTCITTNILALNLLVSQVNTNDKVHFSGITKDNRYILFEASADRSEEMLKNVCERLMIEVINLDKLDQIIRNNVNKDYIEFFELVNKSSQDSIIYIRKLVQLLSQEEIIHNLSKIKNFQTIPILKFKDINNNLNSLSLKGGPFKFFKRRVGTETNFDVLSNFNVGNDKISIYLDDHHDDLKPKF